MKKNKEIRSKVDGTYEAIKVAQADLKKLQEECPHDSRTEKDYYWRLASSYKADICDFCDAVLSESPSMLSIDELNDLNKEE